MTTKWQLLEWHTDEIKRESDNESSNFSSSLSLISTLLLFSFYSSVRSFVHLVRGAIHSFVWPTIRSCLCVCKYRHEISVISHLHCNRVFLMHFYRPMHTLPHMHLYFSLSKWLIKDENSIETAEVWLLVLIKIKTYCSVFVFFFFFSSSTHHFSFSSIHSVVGCFFFSLLFCCYYYFDSSFTVDLRDGILSRNGMTITSPCQTRL